MLDWCLRHPRLVALLAVLAAAPSLVLGLRVGSDFMPQLDEGAFLLQTVLPAEAALDEVDRLNHRVEDLLREVPKVEDVVRRTGRAERTEDPMPHTVSDVLVVLALAVVMTGGLVTSTLFTLLVLPTLYLQVHGWLERRTAPTGV